ncbi:MAG: hypothetical protein NUV53_00355 [Patescibacteria group bacterium]|nr:hypothetical protein [Patescibacteria group bacterium]
MKKSKKKVPKKDSSSEELWANREPVAQKMTPEESKNYNKGREILGISPNELPSAQK